MVSWKLEWQSNFATLAAAPFTSHAPYNQSWTAYPSSWPDTATQRNYPVGGYYDPDNASVVSNGDGTGNHLAIRMWRGTGHVHSCAVVPKAAAGQLYGRYVEAFLVTRPAPGYKSAHLLWPSDGGHGTTSFEVDYPEDEWDTGITAFVHAAGLNQQSFDAHAKWTSKHTTEIWWWPGNLRFLLDGKVIGSTTRGVPDVRMDWIIQNESALNGEQASENSSAQINIYYAAYYSYVGSSMINDGLDRDGRQGTTSQTPGWR